MLILLLKTLFFTAITWLLSSWWQRREKIQCCKQFKNSLWSMSLIGHFYLFQGNAEGKMEGLKKIGREALKQGGVTCTYSWIFNQFCTVVADPMVAETVLKNSLEKNEIMRLSKCYLGFGLLTCPVPEWRQRRKVLNPTFSLRNLEQFVGIFQKNSNILVDKLKTEVEAGPFSIFEYVSNYSLDSICETGLGTEINTQKNQGHPVKQAVQTSLQCISDRMCRPWLYNQTVYEMTTQHRVAKQNLNKIVEFINPLISEKLQQYKDKAHINENIRSQRQGTKTILQLMIDNSNSEVPATTERLLDESILVVFAGMDTTAIAFSFIMMMLAAHPDVQDKVYNEISEVLGDITRPIEPEDLPRLKYTEAVIKETLRLYPPVPIIFRKVENDVLLPNGKNLVSGIDVIVNIWAVHRNTKYWGADADMFRPERFLEPLTHPAAFLSFSYGARNCIGFQYAIMSLKTLTASVLRRFYVTPANKQTGKHEPLRVQVDIIMRHVDNFRIQLEHR